MGGQVILYTILRIILPAKDKGLSNFVMLSKTLVTGAALVLPEARTFTFKGLSFLLLKIKILNLRMLIHPFGEPLDNFVAGVNPSKFKGEVLQRCRMQIWQIRGNGI
jgi:hypothetical protein